MQVIHDCRKMLNKKRTEGRPYFKPDPLSGNFTIAKSEHLNFPKNI